MTLPSLLFWALILGLSIPAVLSSLYLLAATLLSGRPTMPAPSRRKLRFDVIVPAHNEAAGIARTLANLRSLDWPPDGFRLIVVADNCTDGTATIAAANGATVFERSNQELRGKGYALHHAFARSRGDGWADAVVVVDADSEASSNLLTSIAARIECGGHAVQVHYGVLNPHDAWRTRLIAIALGAFHRVRSRAREHLRLSCGVRGNGWCVTHALLERAPYEAFSLAEDVEYGIELGMIGERVHYCDEAHVLGEMVTHSGNAEKQRQRWEQGRFELVRERTLPLLRVGIFRPSRVCLDLAVDMLVLPLTYVGLNILVLAICSGVVALAYPRMMVGVWVSAGCALCVSCYVLRGWRLSGIGWRGLFDLLWAPVFVVWKVGLALRGHRTNEWSRTERERP